MLTASQHRACHSRPLRVKRGVRSVFQSSPLRVRVQSIRVSVESVPCQGGVHSAAVGSAPCHSSSLHVGARGGFNKRSSSLCCLSVTQTGIRISARIPRVPVLHTHQTYLPYLLESLKFHSS